MKTTTPKVLTKNNQEMKKNILILTLFPFIVILFLTLGFSQYRTIIPALLWYSTIFVAILSGVFCLFGLKLRNSYKSRYEVGYFFSFFLLLSSIQLFLSSNIQYIVDEAAGTIYENSSFFSISAMLFVVMMVVISLVYYILSSPKLLFKDIKNQKTYTLAILGGVVSLFVILAIMLFIKPFLFKNPETIGFSYDLLMMAVGIGYGSTGLMITMYRAKKRGDV